MRSTIIEVFKKVALEQEKKLMPLADELELAESGLDSLCLAVIVARLEDAFGFDPFNTEDDIVFPVTFGEFVSFYEYAKPVEY